MKKIITYDFATVEIGKHNFKSLILKRLDNGVVLESTGLKLEDGSLIFSGDRLQYHKHEGYLMKDQIIEVMWTADRACYGYLDEWNDFRPFSQHDELQEDILNYCEYIDNIFEEK